MKTMKFPLFFATLGAVAFFTTTTMAQTAPEKTEHKVRIKVMENVNGVETLVDTSFTVTDLSELDKLNIPGMPDIPEIKIEGTVNDANPGEHTVVIKSFNLTQTNGSTDSSISINIENFPGEELDIRMQELQKELKNAGIDETVVLTVDAVGGEPVIKMGEKVEVKIVMKKVDVEDMNAQDKKLFPNEDRSSFGNNLTVEKIDFYPNPSNGKFKLGFTMEGRGTTTISVFSTDGKRVYHEELPDFTGAYDKEIDISGNASGIYYLKVVQGKKSFFKKLMLE